jgi:hypothetical protein
MCKIKLKDDSKPKYEIQDIFNKYSEQYISTHKITLEQKKL